MLTQSPREPQIARYDLTTIWLHWATVGLIVVLCGDWSDGRELYRRAASAILLKPLSDLTASRYLT